MTDTEKVNDYMQWLNRPLKTEMEAVRAIMMGANSKLSERVKWNAPSYYYKADLVTFHPRATKHVHLVFHHIAIVTIQSPLLHGEYKDRRMMYLQNMEEVEAHRTALQQIMNQLIEKIDESL